MVDNKQQWKAWLYLLPAIILLLVFTIWPIINTVKIAFMEDYNYLEAFGAQRVGRPIHYKIGFGNFKKVMDYGGFLTCLKNTMLFCVLTVPASTFLALLIAVALNAIRPLKRFLQTIFFLPYVTNSIAIGMVFAAMFQIVGDASALNTDMEAKMIKTAGVINQFITWFGGEKINFMSMGSRAFDNYIVMIVYIIWNALPYKILVLLGGLQSVNKQYYDAAKVDGTSKARVFWRITIPLLSPMLSYVLITGFIGGFKEYSSIVGIFGDDMGPTGAPYRLNTMVGYIYRYVSGEDPRTGLASAASLILFGIIFIVTMINLKVSKRSVHY